MSRLELIFPHGYNFSKTMDKVLHLDFELPLIVVEEVTHKIHSMYM